MTRPPGPPPARWTTAPDREPRVDTGPAPTGVLRPAVSRTGAGPARLRPGTRHRRRRGRRPPDGGRSVRGGVGSRLARLPRRDPPYDRHVRPSRPRLRLLHVRHALLREHRLPTRGHSLCRPHPRRRDHQRRTRGPPASRSSAQRPGCEPGHPCHRGPRPSAWTGQTLRGPGDNTRPERRRPVRPRFPAAGAPGRQPKRATRAASNLRGPEGGSKFRRRDQLALLAGRRPHGKRLPRPPPTSQVKGCSGTVPAHTTA
jgi:hypothetical protein